MTSWLEARRLVAETGSRFSARIQIYVGIYLSLVGTGVALCFAAVSGYIDASSLTWPQWISLGAMLFVFVYICLAVMFPYAYVNEQSRYQVESLLELKAVMQRFMQDDRVIVSNPRRIRNQVLRKSILFLQSETRGAADWEEKEEKMMAIVEKAYAGITEAIDEIEKDLDYRPQKLLGFTMYPDRIYTFVTTTATIGFTLIQGKLSSSEES
jgi:hypothetical protein